MRGIGWSAGPTSGLIRHHSSLYLRTFEEIRSLGSMLSNHQICSSTITTDHFSGPSRAVGYYTCSRWTARVYDFTCSIGSIRVDLAAETLEMKQVTMTLSEGLEDRPGYGVLSASAALEPSDEPSDPAWLGPAHPYAIGTLRHN